jgi:superfamily II DNA or RNA helicase
LIYPFPDDLSDEFTFRPKDYYWQMKRRRGWDGYIRLMKGALVPSGLFLHRYKQIEKERKIHFRLKDLRRHVQFSIDSLEGYQLPDKSIEIWEHQSIAVERMMRRSNIGGIVLNATGSGKTMIAAIYFSIMQGSGIFVVDELTLLYQTKEALEAALQEEVGIIGDQEFDPRRITVATIQTLHKYRKSQVMKDLGNNCSAMFLDELHLQLNERTRATLKLLQPTGVFGLTATLELEKDYALFPALALTGPVVYDYPYEKGVREEKLAPGTVVAVDVLRHIEFAEGELEEIPYTALYGEYLVMSPERNEAIFALAREAVKRGKRTAIIVDRIAHIELLMDELADLNPEAIYGAVPAKVRNRARKDFDAGKIKLLICNRVFRKGIDIKTLDTIIEAAGGRDGNDVKQKYGRGARIVSGKTGLIYFDIGDKAPIRGCNPFRDSTLARRRALRELKVTVDPQLWRNNAAYLFDLAELRLKGLISTE